MIELKTWVSSDCTLGRLTLGGFKCFTLELPWRENVRRISCVPCGIYELSVYPSRSHGEVLLLDGVVNRSYIEIHAGNFTEEIQGCILVGDSIKYLNRDSTPDITNSRNTLRKLLKTVKSLGTDKIQIKRAYS